MSIDWFAFVIVAVATLLASMIVVGFYGLGVRLLAVATDAVPTRQPVVRLGAYACFAVCVAAVLYGIYLIVPAFH